MSNCPTIDPLIPGYVDEELGAADRLLVEHHIATCRSCQALATTERAVRQLLAGRRSDLQTDAAPAFLKTRCMAMASGIGPAAIPSIVRSAPARWRARFAPLAAAAVLIFLVGGAFLYQATESSSRVMAAELAADHVKCFAMNAVLGTHQAPETVQSSMASGFGWTMQLPASPADESLELVGSRPCLYGQGKVAHIMYRHQGRPVSLFMLPRSQRPEQVIDVLGHQCAIWSDTDRTFVLVGQETAPDFERLVAFVHRAMR